MKFLTMCAIVKNEEPYLEEWLRYHSLQGVEHFYIHDDYSTDGTMNILKEWENAGKATIYSGFRKPNMPPQQAFYDFIAKEKKEETVWCAFFDIDEFYQGEKTMNGLFGELGDAVSAMEISWCHYGSSGLLKNDGRLVIERFLKHSSLYIRYNRFPKTVAKLDNCMKCNNAHVFEYAKGIILNSGKNDITSYDSRYRLSELKPCWDSCRLNHYHVKSREEYSNKMKKNYADSGIRRISKFLALDRNEIYDDSMLKWVEPIKNFFG